MRLHLRALHLPLVAGLVLLLIVCLAVLAVAGGDVVQTSPGMLTSAAPALAALLASAVLRCPIGELAGTTPRPGTASTWIAAALLWITASVAVVMGAVVLGPDLIMTCVRSCVGYAVLGVIGAVAGGPNLAAGLILGWLMVTALVSAQSKPSWWMWNMPGAVPATTGLVALLMGVAGAVVLVWRTRAASPRLHGS